MKARLRKLDTEMKMGGRYKISTRNSGGGRKRDNSDFYATLIKKMDRFYIFKADRGYLECILKVDFITKDYKVKEA